MRVEQRVGRIYRFGQTKVVQVYHFFNKGTIEEKVQSYFENRLERAAAAIAKVTGEDAEEIKGSLNGQLESEIDPASIYQRAMVEGNLNKETQQEIAEAVQGIGEEAGNTAEPVPDPTVAFGKARKHLEETANLWDWTDDVEFVGLSRVEFVHG